VAIWCHSNKFMEHHQLNGLYSGMFVSEMSEANCYDIQTTQAEVDESNNTFAKILGEEMTRTNDKIVIWGNVKDRYTELAKHNLVAEYNSSRWYYK
jgi:hypothetical protein